MSSRATAGREGSTQDVSRVENDALQVNWAILKISHDNCRVEIPRRFAPRNDINEEWRLEIRD